MSEEELPEIFCPFCGSKDITYHEYYDKLLRRDVFDCFCNGCGRAFLIVGIEEESKPKKEGDGVT